MWNLVERSGNAAVTYVCLSARGVDPAKAIVEYGGEVYAPGADISVLALVDGASLDVFKMTAGG